MRLIKIAPIFAVLALAACDNTADQTGSTRNNGTTTAPPATTTAPPAATTAPPATTAPATPGGAPAGGTAPRP
ncbi:hypothetical protein [Salinarimonas soli]|uniref:Uncharacterized protein n=1 Tax=Salinarimonas soli TaxID=1638099 RepID=A0A5B2VFR4_9HYPH|nr:hypothetical protein [Salinarimonas soli]KAA2237468.1 hypothetical protein F0L46_10765 [Salinarimonas soli]